LVIVGEEPEEEAPAPKARAQASSEENRPRKRRRRTSSRQKKKAKKIEAEEEGRQEEDEESEEEKEALGFQRDRNLPEGEAGTIVPAFPFCGIAPPGAGNYPHARLFPKLNPRYSIQEWESFDGANFLPEATSTINITAYVESLWSRYAGCEAVRSPT